MAVSGQPCITDSTNNVLESVESLTVVNVCSIIKLYNSALRLWSNHSRCDMNFFTLDICTGLFLNYTHVVDIFPWRDATLPIVLIYQNETRNGMVSSSLKTLMEGIKVDTLKSSFNTLMD